MGTQQVLRAAVAAVVTASVALATAAPRLGDRVAVIDLGPGDVRLQLSGALVARGLGVLSGDGIEDALAGISVDRDALTLAAALADAQAKFGALACTDATAAAHTAIAIAASRQAAGLAVPELARAWTYVLLCADRGGDVNEATLAATRLRTLGAPDVDPKLLARYPEVDALSNRETVELEIQTEVAGAEVWVDFQRAGTAPLKLVLGTGSHVIAAASGSRRGALTGTVVRSQPTVTVPMPEQAGPHQGLAARVRRWGGRLPPSHELEIVMKELGVRVALVRHGDTVEAWGHAGAGEPLRRLGDDDGVRPLAEVSALAALAADRVQTWNDRAPDPDQPLLVETPEERRRHNARRGASEDDDEGPTPWWVYASVGAALVVGGVIIYANETADPTQRIELMYPGVRF